MSPQTEQLRIPPTLRLLPRNAPPNSDERPLLRDEQGRVIAVVEQWLPN